MTACKQVTRIPFEKGSAALAEEPYLVEGGMSDWPALQTWTPEYFREIGRDYPVSLHLGNVEKDETKLVDTTLSEYINDYLIGEKQAERDSIPYLSYFSLLRAFPFLRRDIHFEGLFPRRWLYPEYAAWIGVQGSMTGMHTDMMPNFLAQVHGRKRLRLLPYHDLPRQYISSKYEIGSSLSVIDAFSLDLRAHPDLEGMESNMYEVVLHPGEVLYIPKNWWHQVYSMDTTISVNGFMNFIPEFLHALLVRLPLKQLHNWGAYKRGNCSCH